MLSLRGIAVAENGIPWVAGASGTLLRSMSTPTTIVAQEPVGLSAQIDLAQNYPNPFNPLTVVGYRVPGGSGGSSGTSRVRLVVYDLLGREVAVLVDEPKEAGAYAARFDGRGFASGVYLYRLTVDASIQTRKMVLLK
jgi:hypothetical protein